MLITLKTGSNMAQIESRGAELRSLRDAFNTEYIWQRDPKYWGKSSPVLFPVVGELREGRTTFHGKEYHLPKHGFCRDAEFKVTYQSESMAIFNYTYNEETLKAYPYIFSLSLSYELKPEGLTIRYTVMNMDDQPIDFCLGAHPAFNVPVDGNGGFEDCALTFNMPETAGCPVFDFEKKQFDMDNRVTYLNNETTLRLKYSYFDNDAIFFDTPRSDRVRLASVKTGRGVEVQFGGFDYVAFWTPIGLEAPFLCIEPWCGVAVCSDEGDEFERKRGVKHLEIGEQKSFQLTILPL